MRAAIEQNPLGEVKKVSLDTTEREAGEISGENAAHLAKMNDSSSKSEEAAPSGPMEAFEGAANDGFRADVSAMKEPEEPVQE